MEASAKWLGSRANPRQRHAIHTACADSVPGQDRHMLDPKHSRVCVVRVIHKAFQRLSLAHWTQVVTGHRLRRTPLVFRYANVYQKAIDLAASDAVDLSRFVSETFAFDDSVQAFERFLEGRPTDVKLQIAL